MAQKRSRDGGDIKRSVKALYGSRRGDFRPVAHYNERMDFLEVITRDCTAVVCPVNDPQDYFDLIRDGGPNGDVIGVRIWGFGELVHQHWTMYQKLRSARKERRKRTNKQ